MDGTLLYKNKPVNAVFEPPLMTWNEYHAIPEAVRPVYWRMKDAGMSEDYVEVVADGVKTYGGLIDELYALIDQNRVDVKYNFVYLLTASGGHCRFQVYYVKSGVIYASSTNTSTSGLYSDSLVIRSSGSNVYYYSNGNHDNSSVTAAAGTKYRYYYNTATLGQLNTKAENCILNDGTTVENAVKTITAKPSDIFTPETGFEIFDDTIQQIKIGRMVQLLFSIKKPNNAHITFDSSRTKLGTLASGWRPTSFIMTPTSGSDSPNSYVNQLVANLVIVPTDGSVNIDKALNLNAYNPHLEQIFITVCYIGEE